MKQLIIEVVVNGFVVREHDPVYTGRVQNDNTHVFNSAKDLAVFVKEWGEYNDSTPS